MKLLVVRMNKVQNSKSLNFFPNQATETVRLEEALLGTLAIINAQKNCHNMARTERIS